MARWLSLTLSVGISACGVAPEPERVPEPPAVSLAPPPANAAEPQVVVSLPTDMASTRPDVVIKLVFSASMDPTTSNAAFSLTAASGEAITGTLFWDVEARVLAFRPAMPLDFGDYFILVDQRAHSRDGLALPEAFSASFSVADPGPDKSGDG